MDAATGAGAKGRAAFFVMAIAVAGSLGFYCRLLCGAFAIGTGQAAQC